ncbi:MAG: amidohydrolase [Caldilineaceae bacterium]|nr:amidohydrolase [Caldilineaceae bacterium]
MIIDFHNHFFPRPYLDALASGAYEANVQQSDGELRMVLHGDYNIIVEEHHNAAARAAAMDAAGVDMQVLSLTVPGVHSEEPAHGVQLAQIVNDGFADVISQHPTRYTALAALPLQDPAAAVRELERAVSQLGLPGGTLFTHINGLPLDDDAFWPLYEKAVELGALLFIHPTIPLHIDLMGAYRIVAVTGFLYETTTALCRLVYSGVLEQFPTLKLAAAHMGGAVPFIAERADRGFAVYPECRVKLRRRPSEYLRNLYMDTFPETPNAIRFAAEFAGYDKILMGSDYPHQIGDLPGGVQTIRNMAIGEAEKRMILGENARRLLSLADS